MLIRIKKGFRTHVLVFPVNKLQGFDKVKQNFWLNQLGYFNQPVILLFFLSLSEFFLYIVEILNTTDYLFLEGINFFLKQFETIIGIPITYVVLTYFFREIEKLQYENLRYNNSGFWLWLRQHHALRPAIFQVKFRFSKKVVKSLQNILENLNFIR